MLSRRRAPRKKCKKERESKEQKKKKFLFVKWDQCVSLVAKKKSSSSIFLFHFIDE